MTTLQEIAEILNKADDIAIVGHIRPDGDAAGSACALCLGLRFLGKTAYVVPNERIMERFEKYVLPYVMPKEFLPSFVVAVDTPGEGQFPPGSELLAKKCDLAIDHHGTNSRYAKISYIEPESASCGEIIYELLCTMGVPVSKEIAEALYCAITTDTDCFRTAGTTARSLVIAGKLRESGFDANGLTKRLFVVKSPARLKLEGAILNATKYPRPDTAMVIVSRQMLKECGVKEDDLDKISVLTTAAEGIRFGLMVRQLQGNRWKVSVRTDGTIPAGNIAGIFPGGGGHPDSGGAVAYGTGEEILEKMLVALNNELSYN